MADKAAMIRRSDSAVCLVAIFADAESQLARRCKGRLGAAFRVILLGNGSWCFGTQQIGFRAAFVKD